MSSDDRQVCMVDDMEGLSPLAEAYARARGKTCSKCHIITLLPLLFGCKIAFSISVYSLSVLRGNQRDRQNLAASDRRPLNTGSFALYFGSRDLENLSV